MITTPNRNDLEVLQKWPKVNDVLNLHMPFKSIQFYGTT